MKALDNRFYVKFMQLEIGILCNFSGRCFSPPEDAARFQYCVFENETHSDCGKFS